MFDRSRLIAVLALIFSSAVLSSVAYGWRPFVTGTEATLSVCINSSGGLRAVTPGESCKSQEELVVLSTGAGTVGPTGPTGDTGPTGPTGDTGPQGPQGPQGPSGPQGPVGPAGPSGAQGPVGPQGPSGAQGPTGDTGASGASGPAGPAGPAGTTGQTGDTVKGTGTLTLTAVSTTYQLLPGLTKTLTTTGDSTLLVATAGTVFNTGLNAGDFVQVGVRVTVDGVLVDDHQYEVEVSPTTNGSKTTWGFTAAVNVGPGTHTVNVEANLRDSRGPSTTGRNAVLSGSATSPLHGSLTVAVLNH